MRLRQFALICCALLTLATTNLATYAQDSIRVGSWNIEHLGQRAFGQSAAAIADYVRIGNVDVLALQEIYDTDGAGAPYRNKRLDDVISLLKTQTGQSWEYELFPKRQLDSTRQLVGVLWNSKRVQADGSSYKIPVDHENNTLWNRHPYAKKFRAGAQKTDFVVIPLHMKSNVSDPGDALTPVERRTKEAKSLAAAMNEVRSHFKDEDIIILGDTNCLRSDEQALMVLTGLDFKDLNALDAHTYVAGAAGAPFDHILIPDGQPEFKYSRQYQLIPSDATRHRGSLSDHVMIVTTLQVQPDDDDVTPPVVGPPERLGLAPRALDAVNYYANITAQAPKPEFKQQLHQLVKVQKKLSYDSLWDHLAYTDESRTNPTMVALFYTNWTRAKNLHGGRPSNWNREHVWAKSRGQFGILPGAGTDLHHIRPADVSVNGARDNLAFDVGGHIYNDNDGPTTNKFDQDSWEPRNEDKGDVARMLFYMAVRYEGSGEPDLELEDVVSLPDGKAPRIGKLSVLLKWHQADQVDDTERQRNNRIHERQGNRNPFIDHPEWVSKLWP